MKGCIQIMLCLVAMSGFCDMKSFGYDVTVVNKGSLPISEVSVDYPDGFRTGGGYISPGAWSTYGNVPSPLPKIVLVVWKNAKGESKSISVDARSKVPPERLKNLNGTIVFSICPDDTVEVNYKEPLVIPRPES